MRWTAVLATSIVIGGLLGACGGGGDSDDDAQSSDTTERETTTTERETTTTTEPEEDPLTGVRCGGGDDFGLDGGTFTSLEVTADPPTLEEGPVIDLASLSLPQPDAGNNTFRLGYDVRCEGAGYGSTDLYGWMSPDGRHLVGDIGDQLSSTERVGIVDLQTQEVTDVHGLLFDESGDFVETQTTIPVGFSFSGDLLFIDGDRTLYLWDPNAPSSPPTQISSAGLVREVNVEGMSLGSSSIPTSWLRSARQGTPGHAASAR